MKPGNGAETRKALLAGSIGTFVEYYDFGLYGFFATTIAALFFPSSNPTAALLSTFGIFAVGFVIRPLGAIFFGHMGDRIGRRPSLIVAVMLMSAATVALGLLPTHNQIGVAAAVLLLLCRLVQGFSAGGEYSGANIFVIEHAPANKRGRYAAFGPIASVLGFAVGALVSVAMTSMTTHDELAAWGWRIPFLLAAPLALIGLYLRLRVGESPVFAAIRSEGHIESAPVVQALKTAWKPILIMIGYTMTNAVAFYLLVTFFVSYLTNTVKFTNTESLTVQVVALTVLAVALLFAGHLIDILGRKRVAVAAALGLGAWAIPTFVLVGHSSLLGACFIVGGFALLFSGISVSTALAIVELFPPRVRASASALAYQIAYAMFGGTAPYFATWLVGQGYVIAPGYYLAGLCAVSAVVAAIGIGNRPKAETGDEVTPTTVEA